MSGYGIFASYYDALTYNVDYPAMADRLCALIDRFGGDRSLVLDFACGTGSLCAELLRRGCDVIGTDASPDMLGVAREKCEAHGIIHDRDACFKYLHEFPEKYEQMSMF